MPLPARLKGIKLDRKGNTIMQDTGERIIALTGMLYRVTYGLLNNEADREDAVQSAIEKGWRKASSLRDEQKLKHLV